MAKSYELAVKNYRTGITEEDMRRVGIVSPFATDKDSSRSDRYGFSDNVALIKAFAGIDYVLTQAMQARVVGRGETEAERYASKQARRQHVRHLLVFSPRSSLLMYDRMAELVPRIVVIDDSMGMGAFQQWMGFFRIICQNGLLTMSQGEQFRVRHTVNAVRDLIANAVMLARTQIDVLSKIDEMRGITLNADERHVLAQTALSLRYPVNQETGLIAAPNFLRESDMLVRQHREDARDNSLWVDFNAAQENAIRGQQVYNPRLGYHRTRAVNSIQQQTKINSGLWWTAENFRRMRTGEPLLPVPGAVVDAD